MRRRAWLRRAVALLILALLAVGLYRSVVFVDETELVIITQFGRPVDAYRLKDAGLGGRFPWVAIVWETYEYGDAGLHFKLPHQSAIRIDRRLQIYDPRPSEFLTEEKKNVDLDVFVCWRVEDPRLFLETVTDFEGAKARLHDIVWSKLAAEVGHSPLDLLVSTDAELHRLDELVAGVTDACAGKVRAAYGIQIVDVRVKRVGLPSEVRESVFQRMRAERSRIARQYRAEGEEEALKIRAEADKERKVILAQADAESNKIRGEAEAQATRLYAAAHQQDPDFYELVRTLEAYEKFLDDKTTVLLSSKSDLLKYLTQEPGKEEETVQTSPE